MNQLRKHVAEQNKRRHHHNENSKNITGDGWKAPWIRHLINHIPRPRIDGMAVTDLKLVDRKYPYYHVLSRETSLPSKAGGVLVDANIGTQRTHGAHVCPEV